MSNARLVSILLLCLSTWLVSPSVLLSSSSSDKGVQTSAVVLPSHLARAAVDTARHYLHVRERGYNRGKDVDRFNRTAGAPLGSSWCMSAVFTWYEQAARGRGVQNPLLRTGAVWRQLLHAKSYGSGLDVIPVGSRYLDVPALPGDIGCMSKRGRDESLIGGSWLGHAFLVTKGGERRLSTIEGNSNAGGSRNGDQVLERSRDKATILAIIRVAESGAK